MLPVPSMLNNVCTFYVITYPHLKVEAATVNNEKHKWTDRHTHRPLFSLPSTDIFEVDPTQTITEGEGIVRVNTQSSILLFNSCQRRFCFDVSLRNMTARPDSGQRYSMLVGRTQDHGRTIVIDALKRNGFIEIR